MTLQGRLSRLEKRADEIDCALAVPIEPAARFAKLVIYDPKEGIPPVGSAAGPVCFIPDNGRGPKDAIA